MAGEVGVDAAARNGVRLSRDAPADQQRSDLLQAFGGVWAWRVLR
jgi:hypothetical protein